VNSTWSEFKKS
jgi:hypothetical protein